MMKCTYAHADISPMFPSYVSVSSAPGSEDLVVKVRGVARQESTENGGYLTIGHSEESLLAKENALDLARTIVKHYVEQPAPALDPRGDHGIGAELRAKFFPEDARPGETSRVYEDVERVGEVSHTRRLIISSIYEEPLPAQVARLAEFILTNFGAEITEDDAVSRSAVDAAIQLLGDYAGLLQARHNDLAEAAAKSVDLIAVGLRAGQARHVEGETQDFTISDSFVNAGTHAVPAPDAVPYKFSQDFRDVAHSDGVNEPAIRSAPLIRFFPDERGYDVVTPQPPAPRVVLTGEEPLF